MLKLQRVLCGAYGENCYIVNGELIVDPGDDLAAIRAACAQPRAILLTHGHFDHMLAAEALQREFGIRVYIAAADEAYLRDSALSMYDPEAATLPFPETIDCAPFGDTWENFRVLRTPGHTPGSVCLYDAAEGVLLSGDTLFSAGFGRTDLPGGSMSKLISSLRMLFQLPPETRVYPGHGESTTIGAERGRAGW